MNYKKRANGEGSWDIVTKGKHKYYRFRIKDKLGKNKEFYGKTRTEANEKYLAYCNKNPVISTNDIQKMSFYSYSKKWLYEWRKNNISPKTFDYYDNILDNHIKNMEFATIQIAALNQKNKKNIRILFQEAINQKKELSKSTNNGIYCFLSQVCKYGVKNADFNNNFMEGVDRLTENDVNKKTKITKSLTFEQVMQLKNEMMRTNDIDKQINGRIGSYVYGITSCALLFCCFTGLRWGELTRLEWNDIKQTDKGSYYINVDKQFVWIKNRNADDTTKNIYITKYPKEEKKRLIPLNENALDILGLVKERFPEYSFGNNLIFSSTGNPISESNARRTLRSMCKAAKIPEVTPHELRHSFASILLNEDEDNLYTVSALLGHSSPDVTYKAYIDIFEKNKMDTIKIFDKIKSKSTK